MARYKCSICGYVYDEEKEGKPFSELEKCPMCAQPSSVFELMDESAPEPEPVKECGNGLDYPAETRKTDSDYRYMRQIHEMAVTGKPIIEAMGTRDVYKRQAHIRALA